MERHKAKVIVVVKAITEEGYCGETVEDIAIAISEKKKHKENLSDQVLGTSVP